MQERQGNKMAFQLDKVVPWGRTQTEYMKMFSLTETDLCKKIASFGDGPASFNFESTISGHHIISLDAIYQFSKEQITSQIYKTKDIVMQQMQENMQNYRWTDIKDIADLEKTRMGAMQLFLNDFDKGKEEGRYVFHELPDRTNYGDNAFDIGLSSHFLLMYTSLGYEFHIQTIDEMLRICKEIRISPIVDLDGNPTELTEQVIEHYKKAYDVQIVKTSYVFQKNGDQMLCIKKAC